MTAKNLEITLAQYQNIPNNRKTQNLVENFNNKFPSVILQILTNHNFTNESKFHNSIFSRCYLLKIKKSTVKIDCCGK